MCSSRTGARGTPITASCSSYRHMTCCPLKCNPNNTASTPSYPARAANGNPLRKAESARHTSTAASATAGSTSSQRSLSSPATSLPLDALPDTRLPVDPNSLPSLLTWCEPSALPQAAACILDQHLSAEVTACLLHAATLAEQHLVVTSGTAVQITSKLLLLGALLGSSSETAQQVASLLFERGAIDTARLSAWAAEPQGSRGADDEHQHAGNATREADADERDQSLLDPHAQHFLMEAYRWAMYTGWLATSVVWRR